MKTMLAMMMGVLSLTSFGQVETQVAVLKSVSVDFECTLEESFYYSLQRESLSLSLDARTLATDFDYIRSYGKDMFATIRNRRTGDDVNNESGAFKVALARDMKNLESVSLRFYGATGVKLLDEGDKVIKPRGDRYGYYTLIPLNSGKKVINISAYNQRRNFPVNCSIEIK